MFFIPLRNRKANGNANTAASMKDVFFKSKMDKGIFLGSKNSERAVNGLFWVYLCGKHPVHSESFHSKALSPQRRAAFHPGCCFFSPLPSNGICFTYNPSIFLRIIKLTLILGPFLHGKVTFLKIQWYWYWRCNYKCRSFYTCFQIY